MAETPFLSGLGINLVHQGMYPTTEAFPKKFNPYGSAVWALVVRALPEGLPVADAWTTAIEAYVDCCTLKHIHPFAEVPQGNAALLTHLKMCRDALLFVLEDVDHPLLDEYSILEIDRACTLSPDGFVLNVDALFKNEDPTFAQHLSNLGFQGSVNSGMTKKLNQYAALSFAQLEGQPTRWVVSYEITGPMLPELPKLLASKESLERFFVLGIWFPLTKELRPNHQGPRFI